jgi:hypothetical protein
MECPLVPQFVVVCPWAGPSECTNWRMLISIKWLSYGIAGFECFGGYALLSVTGLAR